jgi:hypothetical protein
LFVSDESNNNIRKITPQGNPITFLHNEISLTHFTSYFETFTSSPLFTLSGEVTIIVGKGRSGLVDGNLKSTRFNAPYGLFFNSIDQSLLVCDYDSDKLSKVLLCEGKINDLIISF